MTDLEQLSVNVQRQIDAQNARIDNVLTKVDTIIGEMRDRDNQRVADIKALDAKIDRLGDKIQNMVIAAVVVFCAIVFAAVSSLK